MIRFLDNIKKKLGKKESTTGTITAKEYEMAENQLIKQSQSESYGTEIQLLEAKKEIVS